ncbi:anaphase-promoting complex subunit 1 isoform X1 [Rhineura floridana]|uniref:anaphase-promoting complex subunit 1 isoform X1 n=1 Tax=Rhineura floridana TaxID=261503 RepID=UPI002AC87E37|nr:anaphase-promoting complex subunit 1 isoform X1 [Rhineura floridana]XP_061481514.1 anaphase-promoting complex subunit 1 isoform X1 [Rhineura floridana]XP_061481515.1 anaphase-promoting complex subunit 1 isoform X1 [Rhineura floridana]XP_061481516.1 anaphase-promoting complex subunit 1 isoform X1 [Rhineura floridana]
MSNIYEERVTMIAAGDLQEFVPFGRDHCKHHPNALNLQLRQLQPASELWSSDGAAGLVGSLQEVTIHEKHKESWQLRKGISDVGEEVEYDEELYVAGNMVIWSRGSKNQASAVYKAFTVDSPVLQALWCDFSIPQDKSDKTEDCNEVVEKCICILQSSCINIHSIEGKDHIASLPFQVANVWPTKYGLLFERSSSSHEVPLSPTREPLPTMFSMLHPLDEITPMVCKSGAGLFGSARVQYVADYAMRIVFLNAEPSILMTYDATQSLHTIWALRRVKAEEQSAVLKFSEQVGTPQPVATNSSFTAHLRNLSKGDSPVASPFQNYSSIHSQSRSASSPSIHSRSPSISNMAALSRSHSPALGVHSFSGVQRFNFSSHMQSPKRHSAFHSPSSATDSFLAPETELIVPELCIDHLWTEAFTTSREKNCQASKVFITTDLCGQRFLCYLVESQLQLRCVKFQQSNDMSQLIFGSVTNIQAKDAAPVESIDTMLVLEGNGNLILYTGVVRVGKVFIPGLPAPSLTMSNQMPRPSTPLDSINTPSKSLNKHLGPLDEHGALSPVPELRDSSKLQDSSYIDDCTFQQLATFVHSVRDPVQNRVTLELSNGSMVRISIPEIATSELVKRCLQGIKCILPKEVAVQMLVRWYNAYNAPGGPSYYSEWNLFVTCLMNMMGYNTDRVAWTRNLDFEGSLSPVIAPKKARPSETGSDEDWEYLLNSDYHKNVESHPLAKALRLDPLEAKFPRDNLSHNHCLDSTTLLFPHIPAIFSVLHLIYEELKLNCLMGEGIHSLVVLLVQLARDLKLEAYLDYYYRDYPVLVKTSSQVCVIDPAQTGFMHHPSFFSAEPPSIFQWLSSCLKGESMPPYPYLPGICERSKLVVLSVVLYILGDERAVSNEASNYLSRITSGQRKQQTEQEESRCSFRHSTSASSLAEKLVVWMTNVGFTLRDLESLPFGVALPIRDAIYHCRQQPASDWPEAVCLLIGRQDLSKQACEGNLPKCKASDTQVLSSEMPSTAESEEDDDGMNDMNQEVMSLIWSEDLRVQEVRRLLQSAHPVRVNVVQMPEVSDHEYIEEKENRLLQLCQRTMALPLGRGMFTLFSYHPVPTEPLPIPKLNLTGRAPPRNTTVDLNSGNIDVPPNMACWANFHNGVAAGLKIAPVSQIDSAWIVYNKPKNAELANEYAGFLMALGLNGHLTKLATLNIHDYLTKGHEMTSIGLLLGVSAAKLGTMDMSITRLLSIHIPALLPPTSTELDVPHNVQVAAVIGIGLVYQGTAHRHTAEVLLSEIGRPPGPEMEYCTDRESYSLAAGLALGMVCLGHGSNLIGMSDLNVPEQLYQYMVGGHRRFQAGMHREKHKSPSYQIKEGDTINVDVTCPGATLALAMIYLKTNNRSIADWLRAPDTMYLLDFVKPEFLLLRTLARCLILWDDMLPSSKWIDSNVPQIVRENSVSLHATEMPSSEDLNLETLAQAHVYIIAGACLSLGFRFAGSENLAAFNCLYTFAKDFMKCLSSATASIAGHYNLETCLSVVLLSLAMVMAGSGNLKVLQLCRFMHKKTGGEMNYGFHMAHHMALGLLFLGGGRYSLSTSRSSIAALLCALYPHFPVHSTDNRYHLQALRHLYVLAAEPRLLVPVDVDTDTPCYALLEVTYKGTQWYEETTEELMAPTLLPELHLLKQIRVKGPRYWELLIDLSKGTHHLKSILSKDGVLYVKLRAGQLSYKEDPMGWRSLLAQTVTHRNTDARAFKPEAISAFTSDPALLSFADYFCKPAANMGQKQEVFDLYSSILYECVTQENPEMLPAYIAIDQAVRRLEKREMSETFDLWQIKLVLEFFNSRSHQERMRKNPQRGLFMNSEFLPVMKCSIDNTLDQWLQAGGDVCLHSYLSGQPTDESQLSMLACFLIYHSVPTPGQLLAGGLEGSASFSELLLKFKPLRMPVRALLRLAPLLLGNPQSMVL